MLSTKVNMLLEFVIDLNRKQNYVVNYLNLVINYDQNIHDSISDYLTVSIEWIKKKIIIWWINLCLMVVFIFIPIILHYNQGSNIQNKIK